MEAAARASKVSRRSWLLAGLWLRMSPAVGLLADTPPLAVTWDGDNIHVAAPRLHFLTGKPLERLKSGASVVYLSQLTLFTDARATIFRRVVSRMALSYDLWEEKFSVTRPGTKPRSHLTATEAEAWCLASLAISASGLGHDRSFYLRFEMRPADPKELSAVVGEPGISITGLIEVFSRKPGPEEQQWTLDAGPLRLKELLRVPGRGPRIG
jgi:hypothetical protein